MKIGDLVTRKEDPKHTLGLVVDAAPTGSYIGIIWTGGDKMIRGGAFSYGDGATYHHRFDLVLIEQDKKCPGEEDSIGYITNTTTEK